MADRHLIFPKNYQFKVSKDKVKQYKILKKHLDEADTIAIATDSDQGEAIARLTINLSGTIEKQLNDSGSIPLKQVKFKKGFQNSKRSNEALLPIIKKQKPDNC